MRYSILLLFLSSCLSMQLSGQNTLQSAINQLSKDKMLKHAGLGFCAIDVEANTVIAQHNQDLGLIPASSLKTITTATALGVLGDDYRYETRLEYDGKITSDGTLKGNLYITGQGDPTLGSNDMKGVKSFEELMNELSRSIHKAGIQCIDGYIVGDASYFETAATGRTWIWEDMGNYYGGGTHGLNINENLYYIHFQLSPSLDKGPKVKRVSPEIPNLELLNELTSAGAKSGDNAYIFGAPYTNERYIRGTLPIGKKEFKIKGSIPEPALFTAWHLSKALQLQNIQNEGGITTQRQLELQNQASNNKRTKIYSVKSPKLSDIVERANIKSVNLYCESLLKTMGSVKLKRGTTEAGLEVVKKYWSDRGIGTESLIIKDGSGLSPRNAVSTKQFASILRKIAKDKKTYKSFNASLSVAAESGSLQNMFKGTTAAGKLRAKSGYMEAVRSYTGYTETKSGKLVAFSIIANNYIGSAGDMRRKIEKVMAAIAELP